MLGGSGSIYLAMWIIVPNEPAAGGVIQLRVGSPHPMARMEPHDLGKCRIARRFAVDL